MARTFVAATPSYLRINTGSYVPSMPFTMACWGRPTSATEAGGIMTFALNVGTAPFYMLQFGGSVAGDPVRAIHIDNAAGGGVADTSTGYSINTWHHAAAVFIASNSRAAYIDGGSKGTNAGAAGATSGFTNLVIGGSERNGIPSNIFTGSLAECGVWDVALTDAEIAMLARGYSPLLVRPQSLVSYYPLVRDVDDDIIGKYNMTPINGPTILAHPRVLYPTAYRVGVTIPAVAARIPRHPAQYNTLAIY